MYELSQIFVRAKFENTLDTQTKSGYKPVQ